MHKKLLYRFFEGTCEPDEIEKVRAWVDASSENRDLFFKESALFDAMQVSQMYGKYYISCFLL